MKKRGRPPKISANRRDNQVPDNELVIIITSYEIAMRDKKFFKRMSFKYLVVDEVCLSIDVTDLLLELTQLVLLEPTCRLIDSRTSIAD